ncbi:MAG: hypothetical protein JWP87_773 [Labilithrix sp.]|jgi:hypothetical protein|nr:hypothetical protein [Labilithrix sp.]
MTRIPVAGTMIVNLLLLVSSLSSSACTSSSAPSSANDPAYELPVRATDEAETPLAGVALRIGQSEALITSADGTTRLRARGRTGDEVEVHTSCPEGYVSPTAPLKVTLYHVVAGAAPPARVVVCTRKARKVVTAIRVDGGGRLPIVRFGQAIGATDDSGAAHVPIEGKPGERVELTLDTTEAERGALRPRSPTLSFVIPERDELLVLEQSFQKEAAKAAPRRPSRRATPAAASTRPSRI